MLYTMQVESGIGEALNHVARSALVMMVIVWTVPAWKGLRRNHATLQRFAARALAGFVPRAGARTNFGMSSGPSVPPRPR